MWFKRLLNVGDNHSSIDKFQQLQQQQQATLNNIHQQNSTFQQLLKSQFEFNEIKSYGFSNITCINYLDKHASILAVGSKCGLIRVFGGPSVEFQYQLECFNSVRQIISISQDVAATSEQKHSNNNGKSGKNAKNNKQQQSTSSSTSTANDQKVPVKFVALTDNGQLHLLELRTIKKQNFSDNQTQTDGNESECCANQNNHQKQNQPAHQNDENQPQVSLEYSSLEFVASFDYFKCNIDDDDRSKRVSTVEFSSDGTTIYIGTEGGNVYLIPLTTFYESNYDGTVKQVQQQSSPDQSKPINNIHQENSEESNETTHQKHQNERKEDDEREKVSLDVEQQVTNTDGVIEDEHDNVNDESSNDKNSYNMIKFEDSICQYLSDDIKNKKPGAVESIKKHPTSANKLLLSYHRGLSVIYDLGANKVDKYFYHNQVLESSCFANLTSADYFYTSHNDGSYIKWDTRQGSQSKANEDHITLLYGPYPCKAMPKITACTGLINDQLEDLIIFNGGLEKRNDDDKNRVTIVRADGEGKQEAVKMVFDFTSRVLDFVVITRPRGNLTSASNSAMNNTHKSNQQSNTGGGKKNKNKHQNQQHQQQTRNAPIAVALAIVAEEEFVVIDLLNPKGSANYLEFPLPYLNCIHSSAITCSQLYSNIADKLYEKLHAFCKLQFNGKLSANEWPINGGKVIEQIESKSHDVLLTGHEDGSINIWDVSNLSMRHLQHIPTSKYFSTNDDDLNSSSQQDTSASNPQNHSANNIESNNSNNNNNFNNSNENQEAGSWPPLKKVGRFDPYSDDARLAIRRLTMCRQSGTIVAAGTGGQVVVLELNEESRELTFVEPKEITIVTDKRFVWKGHERLSARLGKHSEAPGYQLSNCVQLMPPVAATSLEFRADWRLFAIGSSYGFLLYDLASNETLVAKSTLNPADFAIISGDAHGTMSRKKSFRKSLRESFRRLRLGRSMRSAQHQQAAGTNQHQDSSAAPPSLSRAINSRQAPAFSRPTTGVRTLGPPITNGLGANTTNGSPSGPSPVPSDHHHHSMQQLNHHVGRNAIFSGERQVEAKVELSSIVRCLSLTWAQIGPANTPLRPSLWVGTNSGQVLIYAISLSSSTPQNESGCNVSPTQQSPETTDSSTSPTSSSINTKQRSEAKLAREIQLKHRAPIVAIFVTPNENQDGESDPSLLNSNCNDNDDKLQKSTSFESSTTAGGASVGASSQENPGSPKSPDLERELATQSPTPGSSPKRPGTSSDQQARVLICTEEQFKVFNLPNLKPSCKYKLTANEGLRAKKVTISHFKKPIVKSQLDSTNSMIKASKSLTSFATQTSRPTTPAGDDKQQTSENNNSPNHANNNHANSQTKDLMAAKFGAKNQNNTLISSSSTQANLSQNQEQGSPQSVYEPYLVCMSNQGDCAIYGTNDLKRLAQVQVCKREDINGIQSTMLTQFGEGYYLKSTSTFLRFSLTNQRVPQVLARVGLDA